MALPKGIVIVGPTASGKTNLGIHLASMIGGEVISADSRQIYRGMDIAMGKEKDSMGSMYGETVAMRDGVPQYCIDIVHPDQSYTLADFQRDAKRIMEKMWERGVVPIIVGGTGLYVQALVDHLDIPSVPPNKELRANMEELIRDKGVGQVYVELLKIDPDAADFVGPNNARRIIRALEVALATGKQFSKQQRKKRPFFKALQIGIERPREELYRRINERMAAMWTVAFKEEVQLLLKKYDPSLPPFSGIGYHEMVAVLHGTMTDEVAIGIMQQRARHYARRQLTWFRRDPRIKWVTSAEEADQLVKKFLA